MHKSSSLNYSLFFFIGSLLMLVPLTSSINFSNVKAQEYGAYDDNYDYATYSKYPTDENKYECRTGPFEGFFVSSVEFCKHIKFDNDKDRKDVRDNRTGAQGLTGPQGPAGFQVEGPEGAVPIADKTDSACRGHGAGEKWRALLKGPDGLEIPGPVRAHTRDIAIGRRGLIVSGHRSRRSQDAESFRLRENQGGLGRDVKAD